MDSYLELERKDLGHRVNPDAVLSFGEEAARLHVDKGMDLTQAVLRVLEGKALNPAHVCRITETANQRAYLLLYDAMPGPTRAVKFEGGPARIFEILEMVFGKPQMAKAAAAKEEPAMAHGSSDYRIPPSGFRGFDEVPMLKVASLEEGDVFMDKMSAEKLAQLMGQGLRSPGGRIQLYHMIKAAVDETAQDCEGIRARFVNTARQLEKLAYEARNEGYTPEQIARAMMGRLAGMPKTADEKNLLFIASSTLEKIGSDLKERSIVWAQQVADGHPLTKLAEELVKTALAFERKNAELSVLNSHLQYITKKLREA